MQERRPEARIYKSVGGAHDISEPANQTGGKGDLHRYGGPSSRIAQCYLLNM